jgi:hypothetical protein
MSNDLRGFSDWRTRPEHYHEPSRNGVRKCARCGAVLRRSNPTDLCAPCAGVRLPDYVPEWMLHIASVGGPQGLKDIAGLLTPPSEAVQERLERDEQIRARHRAGEPIRGLAEAYGLGTKTIQNIVCVREEVNGRIGTLCK